ncbi:MAG TPA: PD-(D/E)XK nuclease family protein [Chryseolinea sp.]
MKKFLYELAEDICKERQQLEGLTVIFPNRRAVLYFRKHLSTFLDKPVFAPRLITIEDFFTELSDLNIPDKLELNYRLYRIYKDIVLRQNPSAEPFDKFYFWGDMLLRDFDEIDKYLVNAGQLFMDLSNQKELDSSFDYLTDEQRDFLRGFWKSFEENLTTNKKKFLNVWSQLHELYLSFKNSLLADGIAYEGLLHRLVAEGIDDVASKVKGSKIIFAGFNALTKAEETLISYFIEKGVGDIYWDTDAYYVNNNTQEAGKFFREYQAHKTLGTSFLRNVPSNFSSEKSIQVFGAAEPVGQTKVMAEILQQELSKGIDPEDTLIVLPDEKLLLPVLHGLSNGIEKLNITMGFPLSGAPIFNLIELLVEMQIARKGDLFNHRHVLALLGHPYVVSADPVAANTKRKEILSQNWVSIPKNFLATSVPLHRLIFADSTENILDYLRTIVISIGSLEKISDLDKEFTFHFLKLLNRMEQIMIEGLDHPPLPTPEQKLKAAQASRKFFLKVFRQLVQMQKIPFSGEPLRGLQIMGVLETRNLDYKNVFVLSLNEGAFPSSSGKGSYIPANIRRAYGLPTADHQDATYAYLFYRVMQRADNIFLFYNSETDVLGQGEMSRYLQQLIYESGKKMQRKVLHNPIQPQPILPISIVKDSGVMEALAKLSEGNPKFKGISPSALNTYIECRLRFYLRHVAKIREADEVEEDLDARVLGNFLHQVMELFYKRTEERKRTKVVEASDLDDTEESIARLIDEVFIEAYGLEPGKKVVYEGQRLVVFEIVKRFAQRIIEIDKAYAPFVMEALEQEGLTYVVKLDRAPGFAILGGKIDRVDRKENVVRVIDYKTGRDKLDFDTIPSLFSREERRNKAAFQTMLYALLYKANAKSKDVKIVPGLINRMNLFDRNFQFGLKVDKSYIDDVDQLIPEFERHLKLLLEELFDPNVPFDQTADPESCKFCPYQHICYR